jgi:hypothetical protein
MHFLIYTFIIPLQQPQNFWFPTPFHLLSHNLVITFHISSLPMCMKHITLIIKLSKLEWSNKNLIIWKIIVLWDATPFNLLGNHKHFRGNCSLHTQVTSWRWRKRYLQITNIVSRYAVFIIFTNITHQKNLKSHILPLQRQSTLYKCRTPLKVLNYIDCC